MRTHSILVLAALAGLTLSGCELDHHEKSPVATKYLAEQLTAPISAQLLKAATCSTEQGQMAATLLYADGLLQHYVVTSNDGASPVLALVHAKTAKQRALNEQGEDAECIAWRPRRGPRIDVGAHQLRIAQGKPVVYIHAAMLTREPFTASQKFRLDVLAKAIDQGGVDLLTTVNPRNTWGVAP